MQKNFQDDLLKSRWDFTVHFNLPHEYNEEAKAISAMVSGVDMGAENIIRPNTDGTLVHRSGRLIFWMNDDLENKMMKAVRKLQSSYLLEFDIYISITHEQLELERYIFTGCALECLQHSLLSRAPDNDIVNLQGFDVNSKTPSADIRGSITNSNNRRNIMKLLQVTFTAMHHMIH